MEIHQFYMALAKSCRPGACEGCAAREFCYTAPRSMTDEIIDQAISELGKPDLPHTDTDSPIHSAHCSGAATRRDGEK